MTKSSTVRHRFKTSRPHTSSPQSSTLTHGGSYTDDILLPTWHFFAILSLMITVLLAVVVIEKQLPPGLKISDETKHPDRFIAERAYHFLKKLTDLGPRVAGSDANEILAVEVIRKEIEAMIVDAKEHNLIELDVQKASGAFPLEFLDGMTNVYKNLQNVVVKIGSAIRSSHSLLINCHFDTVADSPGGSDDGAGCATMIEMIRVISQSDKILRHNIVFLFNGGEENFLPASHGFITQHKWAKEIRAFINLEACGAGGREVLFQAGPNHPWILETYSEQVPYPYASSLAQEIFQSGIIPGDTDYRIFRDFGNVSGLDFAWSANGYVYHTKFDTIEQIPLGTLQRSGDNILSLARGMAQGHQLSQVELHREGNLVFFDFLGAFVLRWSMLVGDLINFATVILSLYCVRLNMKEACDNYIISNRKYWKKLIGSIGGILIAGLASILTSLIIAIILNALGRTMSWFARPFWLFFLYVVPTTLASFTTIYFHANRTHKDLSSPWTIFRLYYDGYQLIWTILLFVGIILRIRSSFIPLYWVLFASIGTLVSKVFKKWRDGRWILLHVTTMSLPFVQSVYLFVSALYLFVPIMGRVGGGNNSELMIAGLVSFFYVSLISFVTPIILLIRNIERVFSLLLGLFLLSLAVLILTPLGFPYSGEQNSLAPQRFMIFQTSRIFHGSDGQITRKSGFWIVDMDINSPHTVDRYVPEMRSAELVDEDCIKYLYCGLPYLVPVQTFIWKTHFIPGPSPDLPTPGTFKILKREQIPGGENVTVEVGGPAHVGVIISPFLGVELKSWSLVSSIPLAGPYWNGRPTYFIFYSNAGPFEPLVFSMEFKIPNSEHSGPIMDIAVTTHYLFGEAKASSSLRNLVDQFPSWAAVTYWSSSYESWIV